MSNPNVIILATLVVISFYIINLIVSTVAGKLLFEKSDSLTLVYSTVLRNLSIAMGLAFSTFGPKAGLILTVAFVIQVQSSAWYGRIADKFGFFTTPKINTEL